MRHPVRALHNGPAAVTVAARHLLRGTGHVAGVPQPWRSNPTYRQALAAYQAGELRRARELAGTAGVAGRLLARLVAGEIALLEQPVAAAPVQVPPRGDDGLDRVLHLVTNALPETVAGYTVRTQGIAGAQRAAGHDVHVLSRLGFPVNQGGLEARAQETVDGVAYHRLLPVRLPLRADAAMRADVARSARLVRRLQPTVLHAHSNHVNGQVGLALRSQFGIPLVYEVRGLLEETWLSRTGGSPDSDFYRLTRDAETRVMRAADAVVTLSESMREQLLARGVPASRIHVVPNCVDAAWWEAPGADPDRTGPFTVGIGSTLNAYEGVDVLIDAVALLRERGTDVRLVVLGSGPAAADLADLAVRRGLGDAATFTGRVTRSELMEAYRGLDVFCLPRRDLPVTRLVPPLKPVEAMAMGLPVVASDLPPLRELLVGGGEDRGLLVRPDDPEALATAVSTLTDAALRRRLGYAGRQWVRETRSWAAAATTYDEIYHELHMSIRGETA